MQSWEAGQKLGFGERTKIEKQGQQKQGRGKVEFLEVMMQCGGHHL